MKKLFSLLLITFLLISLLISFSISPVFAAGDIDVSEITESILKFKLSEGNFKSYQELINSFSKAPGTGEDWFILTLRNTRTDINYQDYRNALKKYLEDTDIKNIVEKQRIALVYLSVNGDPDDIKSIADETIGQLGIMSCIFGLHLLQNGAYSANFTIQQVVDDILSAQKENGGWAIMGDFADVDTTAMAIQALAPFYDSDQRVKDAIDRSITILSDAMQDDGCYVSFGNVNPEGSAQVMLALASIGIDPLKDERFIKNGTTLLDGILKYRLEDGTFSHTLNGSYNKTSTNQALYCLSGYKMFLDGSGSFYQFKELKESEYVKPEETVQGSKTNSKLFVYIGVLAISVVWAVILALKGKKNIKSYLSVIIAAAVVCGAISFIKFDTVDNYYDAPQISEGEYITTTLSINCETVKGKEEYIPEDGLILDFASIKIPKNGTVYDQLVAAAKEYKISLDSNSGYVSGIGYLYEFTFGDLSGWMFRVNGEYASVGSEEFKLSENDYVEWIYTLELGKDIGNDYQ